MSKNVKNAFVGLDSRKNRRLEAKKSKVDFEPQYNGNEPYRANSKAAGKILKNEQVYKNKIAERGVLN
jgi:hypothetical protein